jgi:methyl-accepting chemotaxis protein
MQRILGGSRGLAGAILVFVVAWALVAVLLLTGTLVGAHQIDRDVHTLINPRLSKIEETTGEIRLARQTRRVTGEIRAAAVPLTGQLATTLTTAQQIQRTATAILARAQSINGKVGPIHTDVLAIGATVSAIAGRVQSIHSSVEGIGASVSSVGSDVAQIRADAGAINLHVRHVLIRTGQILSTGRLIVAGVAAINERAVTIGGIARAIRGDLGAVASLVGTGNASATIDGHANAIDCSNLINTALLGARTAGCGR